MDFVPQELLEIAQKVKLGQTPTCSVRSLLSWFWGAKRRGSFIVLAIRTALWETHLTTVPDFDATYLDGMVTFLPAAAASVEVTVQGAEIKTSAGDPMVMVDSVTTAVKVDPSYRVARLKSAHTTPISVKPDNTVSEAITLMMKHDFSQLPVISGERTVKGLISWKSLGKRLAMDKKCNLVREAMEQVHVIDLDTSLFEGIPLIATHDCVLVRDASTKVCGIMTSFDISETFVELAEPFLLLGEIENLIRDMMEGRFSKEELEKGRDPLDAGRTIEIVSDLNFGGYLRLMQDSGSWEKLQTKLDRQTFVGYLERVRIIRNDTMHFDPDGIDDSDLKELREFANLLKQVKHLETG
jgi:CBS domain-containing protein